MNIRAKRAFLFVIAVLTATAMSVTAALSLPQAARDSASASHALVLPVHDAHDDQDEDDWDDDEWEDGDAYEHRRRHQHHPGHRERYIDAPYDDVESGRRVIVDAPFAHVYVGRHGRHVVAPFVDIWIPRRH